MYLNESIVEKYTEKRRLYHGKLTDNSLFHTSFPNWVTMPVHTGYDQQQQTNVAVTNHAIYVKHLFVQ